MTGKAKIFISYKTGVNNNLSARANDLRTRLTQSQYDVWMDTSNLVPGKDWNAQLYEQIPQRQILVLLIAPETGNSDWVRREVDLARGAQVSILPILISGTFDDIKPVLEKFDMPRVQTLDYSQSSDEQYKKLIESLDGMADEARERQKKWLLSILQDKAPPPQAEPPADLKTPLIQTNQHYASFMLIQSGAIHPCKIHLAAGNMLEMKDIDVLVNTENDFMQMARMFETNTISTVLRWHGAHFDSNYRLIEDTVHDELNEQIFLAKDIKHRPVEAGTVIATSAGNRKSYLSSRIKARYIFHVATVLIERQDKKWAMGAVKDNPTLKKTVIKTLNKIFEVDQGLGIISPTGTTQRQEQEKESTSYKRIKSIMFPLFGAGRGGRSTSEVVKPMLQGFQEFLSDNQHNNELELEHIYLAVYNAEDIPIVEQEMNKVFQRERNNSGN